MLRKAPVPMMKRGSRVDARTRRRRGLIFICRSFWVVRSIGLLRLPPGFRSRFLAADLENLPGIGRRCAALQ